MIDRSHPSQPLTTFRFALPIFLGAGLLFMVQPLVARMVLPWFGGSASVWATCMLFFQLLLLGGYTCAHFLSRLPLGRQQWIYFCLLLLCLPLLPLTLHPHMAPSPGANPNLSLLWLLLRLVGLPYWALAATSPLLQAWFRDQQPGRSPYKLYALSNLGSMLALLSYPLIVEPLAGLRLQGWTWSGAFLLFTLLVGYLAWSTSRQNSREENWTVSLDNLPSSSDSAEKEKPLEAMTASPKPSLILRWVLLAMASCTLMLSVTTLLTQNVAPIPLLWVPPLAVYLLTFTLCFDGTRWYRRPVYCTSSLLPVRPGASRHGKPPEQRH